MLFPLLKKLLFCGGILLLLPISTAAVEPVAISVNSVPEDGAHIDLMLEQNRFTPRALAKLAEAEHNAGEFDNALNIWKALLKTDNPEIRNWAALWIGIIDSSLSEKFPDDVPWGAFWTALQKKENEPWKSLEILANLKNDTLPDIVILMSSYWRGLIFENTHNIDSARIEWESLVERYPNNLIAGELLYRIGNMRFHDGNYGNAELRFAAAIKFYENSDSKDALWWADEAAYLRIISLVRMEEFDSAESAFSVFAHIAPESDYITPARMILAAYDGGFDGTQDSIPAPFRADLLMKEGWDAYDRRKYRQAMMTFLEAYDVKPSQDALLFAAESAYRLKEYKKADSLYELMWGHEQMQYSFWGRGWCKMRMGDYDSARVFWEYLLGDPLFADAAAFANAKSYYFQRKLSKAIEELGKYLYAYKKYRGKATAYLFFAQIEHGDTLHALETAARYLKEYPVGKLSGSVALSAAKAMFERHNYGALQIWVDSNEPNFPSFIGDSMVFLSERAKYHAGEYTDPISILNGVIQRRPESRVAINLSIDMGRQFEDTKRWNDAIYIYSKGQALMLPGDTAWCETTLGILRSQLDLGDTAAAFASLRDITIDGTKPWSNIGRLYVAGWIWKNFGDSEHALRLYADAIRYGSDSPVADSAALGMGQLYFSAQMFAEARTAVESRWRALEKSDTIAVEFAKLITEAMWEQGFQDSAMEFAIETTESLSMPCEFLVFAGKLALSQGRPELAGAIMGKISKAQCVEVSPNFLLQMGDAMVQLERISDACSLFTLVVERHPDDSLGEIARKRLKVFSLGEE